MLWISRGKVKAGKRGVVGASYNLPSGSTPTITGSSTHRLLTEIQEPMANRAMSPWLTAALLHHPPDMVALSPANSTEKR